MNTKGVIKTSTRHNRFALAAMLLAISGGVAPAQLTVLHTNEVASGAIPYYGAPVISGSKMYGVTSVGGSSNKGVVFSMNLDGSGYTALHTFTGTATEGSTPYGSVILSGSTLYGTSYYGGSGNVGTIFSVNTDGSSYQTLYSCSSSTGNKPYSTLTLDGGTLYGMTYYYGASSKGSLFSISTNGAGYNTLYAFAGGADSGATPLSGPLTKVGSALSGTTAYGGDSNTGVVFKIQTDGTGYTNLYDFADTATSGARPYGSLNLVGSELYGLARNGGVSNNGVVFKLQLDGSGYTDLYDFTGAANSGSNPNGSLTLSGSMFYGTTRDGGVSNNGVVFALKLDGSGYTNLVSFTGGADGKNPVGTLAVTNDSLYGWTSAGGTAGKGTIFSLAAIPEPGTVGMMLLFGVGLVGWRRLRS